MQLSLSSVFLGGDTFLQTVMTQSWSPDQNATREEPQIYRQTLPQVSWPPSLPSRWVGHMASIHLVW